MRQPPISSNRAPGPGRRGVVRAALRLTVVLVVAVALFSAGFLAVMETEGRQYSWLTAVYWTLVTMSTLGFGDIVFTSDLGRVYSLVVLLSGALLILVLLPFSFIQLVYLPWRAATRAAQTPRQLPDGTRDHVLLTDIGPVGHALLTRASAAGHGHAIVVDDVDDAARLQDEGYRVVVGPVDDPATWRAARVEHAALVFTARGDAANANVVFTVREVTSSGHVVSTANSPDSVDVLELAGADHVVELGEILGRAFARRILSPTARSSPISTFEDLVIAEASASGTELVGRRIHELDLRRRCGVSVVALWDRGTLRMARPLLRIEEGTVLVLVGRADQLAAYDRMHAPADAGALTLEHPVVIVGGGRVGRATARALDNAGIASRIVERDPSRVRADGDWIVGDAADLDVLRRAGIEQTPAVVVTTHDDDVNVFLTLYCRRLREDVEILGRVVQNRNLVTMHRAGADFVLSYASTAATEVWNTLRGDEALLLAEGLIVFRVPIPAALAGRHLRDVELPEQTGCSVIALSDGEGWSTEVDPDAALPQTGHLVLIGDDEAEAAFLRAWTRPTRRLRRRSRRTPTPAAPVTDRDRPAEPSLDEGRDDRGG